jgi:hypothetical protein
MRRFLRPNFRRPFPDFFTPKAISWFGNHDSTDQSDAPRAQPESPNFIVISTPEAIASGADIMKPPRRQERQVLNFGL